MQVAIYSPAIRGWGRKTPPGMGNFEMSAVVQLRDHRPVDDPQKLSLAVQLAAQLPGNPTEKGEVLDRLGVLIEAAFGDVADPATIAALQILVQLPATAPEARHAVTLVRRVVSCVFGPA